MYGEVVDGGRAPVRAGAHRPEVEARRRAGHRPHRRRPRGADRDLQGDLPREHRRRLPAGRPRAAPPRRARGLRLVGHPARQRLPPRTRDPGRPRHRRQRRADGLRQQGRRLRHRGLLHARPLDRRAGRLRRVPRERAGRGRRRRHPHARAARGDAVAHARRVRAAARDDAPPRAALPRHAGHRVHRRGGRLFLSRRAPRSGPPPPR